MDNFTFDELSPLRFEKFVRDLLTKYYGRFENFAEGKDGGIDFRYSSNDKEVLIVQCKRYKEYKNLKYSLQKTELPKIKKLKFDKYLLVVSLDLSPSQKEEIFNLFNEYLSNPNQILTRGDLNALIQENRSVIHDYPELWMKSIDIHQRIFNIGILHHSGFIKDRISKTLINFVPTENYKNVINHFIDNKVLIISGNPGAGKSTLAYATLSHFIYHYKYKIVDLSYRNIQEAEPFLASEEVIFFLLDDFLGRIKLDKNDDFAHLLSFFIEKIENCENKKLIITSRNHILESGAKNLSAINNINNFIQKHTIELKELTRSSRTMMLYNHIYNSNIDIEYLNNLLHNNYKRIIDHPNFNPRIIEHLTNNNFLKKSKINAENYYEYFIQNLENSSEIWSQFYTNLPNDLYKLIIINKFIINDIIPYEKLENAVMKFIVNCPQFQHYSFDDFEQIIRELNGTIFIIEDSYNEMRDENYQIVEFHNPSIIDFLDNHIWKNKFWLKIIIENATYFEQLFNWELQEIVEQDDELLKIFKHKVINGFNGLENASFGFFEYDIDGGTTTSWKGERRNYFLQKFSWMYNIKNDSDVYAFIIKELFKYPIDGAEDTSEKIAFAQICEELLEENLIEDKKVILNYTNGFFNDIKELVYLEYLLRHCSDYCLDIIRSNNELVETADRLFIWQIENIQEEPDYLDIIDFLDDFKQIKNILPLKKASKLLKKIDIENLIESSFNKIKEADKTHIDNKKNNYADIKNEEIETLINSLKKKL
ncbi:restriction endonuclease [Chryseobacterium sp.]|uniref:restriction endonuclease n=1 Tax=Chryseobacterium sp. TaxID=1871047 RepID=UPI001B07DC81|nr:restriction endonuclease [Chryseobacterium sp.]MBO9692139.1 restriction endonuclease [Chryseobacterium sp.]